MDQDDTKRIRWDMVLTWIGGLVGSWIIVLLIVWGITSLFIG